MTKKNIVVGTWPLSGDFGLVDCCSAQETLEHCYNLGLREFDAAPNYGNGYMEFVLGKVLGGRQDVEINTKVGNMPFWGKSFAVSDMTKSVEESLKRLNSESINILFLHNPRAEVESFEEVLAWGESLKKSGKVKKIGLSVARNYDYSSKVDWSKVDVVQDDANLLYMDSLFNDSYEGRPLMARSPLASGILSGNLNAQSTFSSDDHRASWLKEDRLGSILKRIKVLEEVSEFSLPILARQFVLNHPKIDRVIFGVKRPTHADDIMLDLDRPKLDVSIIAELEALYEKDFGLQNEKHLNY